mgnify:CR=1 FL=1
MGCSTSLALRCGVNNPTTTSIRMLPHHRLQVLHRQRRKRWKTLCQRYMRPQHQISVHNVPARFPLLSRPLPVAEQMLPCRILVKKIKRARLRRIQNKTGGHQAPIARHVIGRDAAVCVSRILPHGPHEFSLLVSPYIRQLLVASRRQSWRTRNWHKRSRASVNAVSEYFPIDFIGTTDIRSCKKIFAGRGKHGQELFFSR